MPVNPEGTVVRLTATARAPGEARRAVARFGLVLAERELESLRLLVSELVTNSVRHAGLGPDDRIDLHVAIAPELVRVSVTNPGGRFEVPPERPPRSGQSSGWGLFLVKRLADRWGVSSDGHTRVWFELRRPA
jgi:anti-sigma regulatory factor (Ser/Thr protein kinase)